MNKCFCDNGKVVIKVYEYPSEGERVDSSFETTCYTCNGRGLITDSKKAEIDYFRSLPSDDPNQWGE